MIENIKLDIDKIAKDYGFELLERKEEEKLTYYVKMSHGIEMKMSFDDSIVSPFIEHKEIDEETGEETTVKAYTIENIIDNLNGMFSDSDKILKKEIERMKLYE